MKKVNVVPLRQPSAAEPELSDEALALACSTRDPAAVAELFERFHRPVLRFLSRLVSRQSDAEDLLQATFLEVARGSARFEGRSAVSTWLIGIAANVARHHIRSTVRQRRLRTALTTARQSEPPRPPGTAEARLTLGRVQRALDGLSPELRLAFVLCELEGWSAQDAARTLGVRETAIWKRVSDARKALRRAAEGGAL